MRPVYCGEMLRRLEIVENVGRCVTLRLESAADVRESLAGDRVLYVTQPGKGDLSDWVELMEAVEALCLVWPVVDVATANIYKL